ncbi:MAG: NUDIX domain-containing protein [Candidatus Gottesmanbacteria bacterium]
MKKGIDYIGVSVGALIFNKKGEIFLTKRSKNTKNEHGCWEAPGGGVEFGETLQDAIKREIKEEYGVDIILLKQLPAQNHLLPKESQHWVPTSFIAKIKNGQTPKIMEPEKCDNLGWFPLNKLPRPLSVITKLDLKALKKDKINISNYERK